MAEKMDQYVAPLVNQGVPVSKILRLGSPRHVIVEVAAEIAADLLVIGSHSKRGLLDIALGDTARHVSTHAPCEAGLLQPGSMPFVGTEDSISASLVAAFHRTPRSVRDLPAGSPAIGRGTRLGQNARR